MDWWGGQSAQSFLVEVLPVALASSSLRRLYSSCCCLVCFLSVSVRDHRITSHNREKFSNVHSGL